MAKAVNDDLAEIIASTLNKEFKDGKVAYVGTEETPTDLVDFVSTGCMTLDLAISNRPHGGIPYGRITELTGLEGSGKSLVAAHVLANCQKAGGVAVLIDTETAVNWEFFEAVGVNREKNWIYAPQQTVEDIFDSVEFIIETVRRSSKDRPVVIVVDSIAGASTKKEMEADYGSQGYATDKAILLSKAMRKVTSLIGKQKIALILTNQLRQKLNAMPFADPWTTSGGKAIAFHSSVRIRFAVTGKITKKNDNDDKEILGVKIKAQVTKNRVGPPLRTAEFDVYFDRGIDNYGSWLQYLRDKEIIVGKSNALTYTSEKSKKEYKFSEKEWKSLLSNKDFEEEVYNRLCDSFIMSYTTSDLMSDDVSVDKSIDDE